MSIEGTLSVSLSVEGDHVRDASVRSARPARAASVLGGRPAEEALRLAPLLFPVCGAAHGVACARAVEAALGRTASARLEAARDAVCLAEASASHAMQLGLVWAEAAGRAPDARPVREARAAFAQVTRGLLGDAPPAAAREPSPDAAEVRRAAAAVAAAVRVIVEAEGLTGYVLAQERASFGASSAAVPAVTGVDLRVTGARLAADPAFAERAELASGPVDVSAYARRREHAEVARLAAEHGAGLLARFVARKLDAVDSAVRLAERVEAALDVDRAVERAAAGPAGEGVGLAETARGPLVYWVRVSDGRVLDARVVAPTDWTFHPRGALARGLAGVRSTETLARDARWLVLALDPCVAFTVEVRDA